jgi:hypothetical protein
MAFKRLGSREAARRVEVGFHRRPRPVRRTMWMLGVASGVLAAGWAGFAMLRGEQRPFAGGSLSRSHGFFENDCAACHSSWGPLQRLLVFSSDLSSISEEKCFKCHAAPAHHAGRTRTNEKNSCASCHHEHQGDHDLRRISDQHCVDCHSDLKTVTGNTTQFFSHITEFRDGSHPEFDLHRIMEQNSPPAEGRPVERDPHAAYQALDFIGRDARDLPVSSAKDAHWQDRAAIRFNHAKHLNVQKNTAGEVLLGLIREDGRSVDWSKDCRACHQPAADGRLMQPISYAKHCASCHPLYFDPDQKQVVPHAQPEIVHGWLTNYFTMQSVEGRPVDPEIVSAPHLPFPGRALLDESQAKLRSEKVRKSEESAIRHTIKQFNRSGGCSYCHAFQDRKENYNIPEITPPRIPRQWLGDSRFNHHSHRMLTCTSCHAESLTGKAVEKSDSTGDVLIPKIDTCFRCHSLEQTRTANDRVAKHFVNAGNHCVDCHTYHSKRDPPPNGILTIESFSKSTALNKAHR